MFENIKKDYMNPQGGKATLFNILKRMLIDTGFRAVVLYRLGRWCRLHKLGFLGKFLERMISHLCHVWLSTLAEIGPGFRIAHVCGIIIPPRVVFGANCCIRQNVTIGGNYHKKNIDGREGPVIGDNVSVGPGAAILGPITIGNNCIIGANALVTTSIPDNSVVGAFRAEVVACIQEDGSIKREEQKIFLSRRELFAEICSLKTRVEQLEKNANGNNSLNI
jgi:serine O-acetyltransferase